MAEIDLVHKQQLLNDASDEVEKKFALHFRHVNVRKSISLLLMRLITLEIITAVAVIIFHYLLINVENLNNPSVPTITFNLYLFLPLVFLKLVLICYVILEWHEEYYEISATEVSHYRGYIFKHHEVIKLEHIASVKLEQGILGRVFNYGTIRLHSWYLNTDYFLYQIHNPNKYEHVLGEFTPKADRMKKVIREHIITKDSD